MKIIILLNCLLIISLNAGDNAKLKEQIRQRNAQRKAEAARKKEIIISKKQSVVDYEISPVNREWINLNIRYNKRIYKQFRCQVKSIEENIAIIWTPQGKKITVEVGKSSIKLAKQTFIEHAKQVRAKLLQEKLQADKEQKLLNAEERRVISILRVETDLDSYRGKIFTIEGTIKLSTYYNYLYGNAKRTHFAFRITEKNYKSCHVYISRNEPLAIKLREWLLKVGNEGGHGKFKLIYNRYDPNCSDLMANLVGVIQK